jgi:hypothetical protein
MENEKYAPEELRGKKEFSPKASQEFIEKIRRQMIESKTLPADYEDTRKNALNSA